MQLDLSGRTALVTGSSQGIGLAIATGLAQAGARVALNGRRPDALEAAAATLQEAVPDADVLLVAADLSTGTGADAAIVQLPEPDILVNNLGIFGALDPFEIDDATWEQYFQVNVMSAVRMLRAYLPGMQDRGWGRAVTIASDSAIVIPAEMIHYGVTKTALLGVTRGFAKAVAGSGVTVNTVIAGPTHTPGVEEFVEQLVGTEGSWDERQRKFMLEHRPQSLVQRLLEPAEIANAVVYLCSDLASATTGAAMRADGGYVDSILP
jgi:NAD(P)-dependent dehydrogenase (short-subunit alcohol dehydrogenase family)